MMIVVCEEKEKIKKIRKFWSLHLEVTINLVIIFWF